MSAGQNAESNAKSEAKTDAKHEVKPETKANAKTEAKAEVKPAPKAEVKPIADRKVKAKKIVKRYARYTLVAGAIPFPPADIVVVTGLQIKLIAALSKNYDLKFSHDRAKAIVSCLIGGLGTTALSTGAFTIFGSLFKAAPGVGTVAGVLTVGVFSYAVTRAIGAVFIKHFEAGGNLLNFDVDGMRKYFIEEFEKASKEVPPQAAEQTKAAA